MHLHYTDTPVVQRPSVNIQSLLLLAQLLLAPVLSVPALSNSFFLIACKIHLPAVYSRSNLPCNRQYNRLTVQYPVRRSRCRAPRLHGRRNDQSRFPICTVRHRICPDREYRHMRRPLSGGRIPVLSHRTRCQDNFQNGIHVILLVKNSLFGQFFRNFKVFKLFCGDRI